MINEAVASRHWLPGHLMEKPDLTLHTLRAELPDRGVTASCDTLWSFLREARIGKKPHPPELAGPF